MDEVKVTRRPDGTVGGVSADADGRVLLVWPATSGTSASPSTVHAVALAADLPAIVVRERVAAGHDVVIGGFAMARHAYDAQRQGPIDADALKVLVPATSRYAAGVSGALALATFAFGLFAMGPPTLRVLFPLLIVAAFALFLRARRARDTDRDLRTLRAADADLRAELDPLDHAAWTRLQAAREASLDPELPPSAAADLWTALERAETAWLAGDPVDLDLPPAHLGRTDDALDDVERALAAARAARAEVRER